MTLHELLNVVSDILHLIPDCFMITCCILQTTMAGSLELAFVGGQKGQ